MFDNFFLFWYQLGLHNMHKSSHLGEIILLPMWFRMSMTKISWVYKYHLTFDVPITYQYVTSVTILIPMGIFFDNIVGVNYWYHVFTYHITNQHRFYSTREWSMNHPRFISIRKCWDFTILFLFCIHNHAFFRTPRASRMPSMQPQQLMGYPTN